MRKGSLYRMRYKLCLRILEDIITFAGKLNFYGVFCIIGYVFIYYVKQCFADIVAQVPMQYATLKLR